MYNEKGYPAYSIRILTKKIQSFEELNLPKSLKNMIRYKNGLVLITGPTGSGKSTTLSAMIEEINKRESLSIVTIEDPVEYIFENKKSLDKAKRDRERYPVFCKCFKKCSQARSRYNNGRRTKG